MLAMIELSVCVETVEGWQEKQKWKLRKTTKSTLKSENNAG